METIILKAFTRADLEMQIVNNAQYGYIPAEDVLKVGNEYQIKMVKPK